MTLVSGPSARRAAAIVACGRPGRTLATAPETQARTRRIVKVRTSGVPRNADLDVRMLIKSSWVAMGHVKSNAQGSVTVPTFIAERSGTYPMRLTARSGDRLFTSVVTGRGNQQACPR